VTSPTVSAANVYTLDTLRRRQAAAAGLHPVASLASVVIAIRT
jgi:hypothetical protein